MTPDQPLTLRDHTKTVWELLRAVVPSTWIGLTLLSLGWAAFARNDLITLGGIVTAVALVAWGITIVPSSNLRLGDVRKLWLVIPVVAVHLVVSHVAFIVVAPFAGFLVDQAQALVATATRGLPPVALAAVAAFVVAPTEEVAWRGLLQGELERARQPQPGSDGRILGVTAGQVQAIAVTTIVFAVFHLPTGNLALVGAALLGGIAWGWLRAATGGMLAPMIAHGIWTGSMALWPPV